MSKNIKLNMSRRIRRTPYTNKVEDHGVSDFTVVNHMLLPKGFKRSVEDDYWHLNKEVQIWDVSCQRQVQISGPDAFKLVQKLTPRSLERMETGKCFYIPILDENEKYLGCTSIFELMTSIANTSSMKEKGGILILEVNELDYSMAQIGQIVESNEAKILSSTILSDASSTKLHITLKINQEDLTSIIRTFERYDYVVKASYQNGVGAEDLQWRYDALMNYLNF